MIKGENGVYVGFSRLYSIIFPIGRSKIKKLRQSLSLENKLRPAVVMTAVTCFSFHSKYIPDSWIW